MTPCKRRGNFQHFIPHWSNKYRELLELEVRQDLEKNEGLIEHAKVP